MVAARLPITLHLIQLIHLPVNMSPFTAEHYLPTRILYISVLIKHNRQDINIINRKIEFGHTKSG